MAQSCINYKPLNPRANEIRLVRLKSLKHNRDNRFDDHHVICELEHVGRTERIEYTALSYAWQDGREQQQITIANNMQNVSANLAAAIKELRDETNDILLWIDQLCINQTDDAEKAQQVQEMKSIYERASHVAVWIGRRADNSDW
jgi:Heterokaryon incompatibility protein (HET)